MKRIGFYPGSFDPITNGHLDIIHRACHLVDELVVGVGAHHEKKGLFLADERVRLLQACLDELPTGHTQLRIVTFSGLVVDGMRDHSASIMIRGLRDTTDYNYEMQMAGMNTTMSPDIQIVFLPSSPKVRHIAASLVRQIAAMEGDISEFVPARVAEEMRRKLGATS